MTLLEIYNKIRNESKINDDNFLEECLDAYVSINRAIGDLGTRKSGFYDKLVSSKDRLDNTTIDGKSEETFYVKMTNDWIQNILSLTPKDIENLKKSGLDKYEEIQRLVSRINKVKTMEEVISLYNKIDKIIGKEFALESNNYFWRSHQEYIPGIKRSESSGIFYHVRSRYTNARRTKNIGKASYRLYVNCQCKDLFDLTSMYVSACKERNIPYYFKYIADVTRRDKFLIYCEKELLKENINILKEIAVKRPDIATSCCEMLSLIGSIDNWIGIASEPHKIEGKEKFSFNTMRAEILEDSAELLALDFIKQNRGKILEYNGIKFDFDINMAKHATKIIINEAIKKKDINKNDPNIKKYLQEIMNQLTKKINGKTLIDLALKRIEEVFPKKNYLIGTNGQAIFKITLSNGKELEFNINITDALLKSLVGTMKKVDPKYIEKYRKIIKERCKEYQVDPENFAFNDDTLEEFKQLDELEKKDNKRSGLWNKENFDYVNKILSTIPEKLLKMKLENGMGLLQYFTEVVVDRMDENKNYIEEDGRLVPVEILIKETIKKRSLLNKHSQKNSYYVIGILSMIDDELLNTKLSMIEGLNLDYIYNDISLKQYFLEVVVDRMDENQNYIDFDGTLIPIKDYIISMINKIENKNNYHK